VSYLGAGRTEKLDVYLPAKPAPGVRSPAFVCIHGGGWMNLSKSEGRSVEICTTLAKAGYVTVSIDYRMGPGAWPTNLFDCKNAVRFLRAHAADYRLDPERIAVGGGSAGGHLAQLVGFTSGNLDLEPVGAATPYPGVSDTVRAVVDLYGPSSVWITEKTHANQPPAERQAKLAERLAVFGAADATANVLRVASPITHITNDSPPVLILHGLNDPNVELDQSRDLAAAQKSHGVAHELIFVEGAGHSFDLETWNKQPLSRDLRPVVLAFLAKHLLPAAR
jgi:acetyl esterase/lipase